MNKKFFIIGGIIGSLIAAGLTTYAAIAVVDVQNIAKTAQVYAETVNMVKNTAQQITLQAKELLSFPADVLNNYTSAYTNSINDISSAMRNTAYNFSTGTLGNSIDNYWKSKFVTYDKDHITDTVLKEDYSRQYNVITEDNKKYSELYYQFQRDLEKKAKLLGELLQKSATVEGQKQSQQLNAQIAGVKANIELIKISMDELDKKRKLEAQQMGIGNSINLSNLGTAKAESTEKFIKSLHTDQKASVSDDPFLKGRR